MNRDRVTVYTVPLHHEHVCSVHTECEIIIILLAILAVALDEKDLKLMLYLSKLAVNIPAEQEPTN